MNTKNMDDKLYFAAVFIILLTAVFARFYLLDKRPMYFDEGTHWLSFMDKIHTGQKLIYIPDFHGFTSWYLSAVPLFFLGKTIFAIRFMVALFGVLTVAMFFLLKNRIGRFGIIISSLFMAMSPSFAYYSKQTSQYPYIVFFTMLSLIFIVLYFETKKMTYLYFLAADLALLITTHEIGIIYIASIISFLILYYRFNPECKAFFKEQIDIHRKDNFKTLILCTVLFFIIIVVIMSCFFTNFDTLKAFMKQSAFQFDKSYNTGHNKNSFYYVKTFFTLEMFAFIGTISSIFVLKRNPFSLFLFFWTWFSILVFFILPYKVPLMFILVLLPMYLLSGLVADNLFEQTKDKKYSVRIFCAVLMILFLTNLYYSVKVNHRYITARLSMNPLNYAGPVDDNYRLIKDLDTLVKNNTSAILFAGDSFWPLHYYLRDQKKQFAENNVDLAKFYTDYGIFIITRDKYYDKTKLKEFGVYELRENYFIRILTKIAR